MPAKKRIKNADEATESDGKILLVFSEEDQKSVIKVIDNGQGFANLDNLFVPLYSTKQGGQGIGLSFCRNIIEHHNGTITLENNSLENSTLEKNTEVSGVTVTITLPLHKSENNAEKAN